MALIKAVFVAWLFFAFVGVLIAYPANVFLLLVGFMLLVVGNMIWHAREPNE